MRHRGRRPKKSAGRIVAQCTRWNPLGWGFCVPNDQPNRSIYVHCSKVVGAGEGFVKLHKYALYEFNVLPPEPGKRYERATDITLPGGEPIPLEPKVLRNIMIEERKKQESSSSEAFFSSRSTSDGGHDSSFQSDDLKATRDDSSLGELSREAESIDTHLSRSTAETVEYEHHHVVSHRRYPPGLGGPKYARDRRKANGYREAKNYYHETKSSAGAGRGPPLHVDQNPTQPNPPDSAWKDIPSQPNLETEWSPVTDSDWSPNINPPPKYNLNYPCHRDHAIWSSNQSQSLWSPIYFDSVLEEEEPRPDKNRDIPWDPVTEKYETYEGIMYMGLMIMAVTLVVVTIHFPMWGGMLFPGDAATTEEDYYTSAYTEEEKQKGMADAAYKFSAAARASERGPAPAAEGTTETSL